MFGYLIAIILPPVPMLQQGKMGSAIVTFLLMCTVVGWPLASIWAVVATRGSHIEDKRVARMAARPTVAYPAVQLPPGVYPCPKCGAATWSPMPACGSCGAPLTWQTP